MKTTIRCQHCKGLGEVDTDIPIQEWTPPVGHEREEELDNIAFDARAAVSDHAKLCAMNPRAKEAYDAQLAAVLFKFEAEATELLG